MSWQPYIDDHLQAELPHGGQIEHAAILSHNGDVWAQSPNFPEISPEEAESILKGFDDQATLAQNGLYIGGSKYIVVRGDEGAVIRGKLGPVGVTIKKTTTGMVFGIYDQTCQAADANLVVENMGDYLMEQDVQFALRNVASEPRSSS